MQTSLPKRWPVKSCGGLPVGLDIGQLYHGSHQKRTKKTMKNTRNLAATFVAALLLITVSAVLAPSAFAQDQGLQSLTTTTLSSAVPNVNGGSGITSGICLASITNVTATVSVQTTLYVDTEAMDVVTNTIPPSGTCVTVTRGTHGTKAEGHASGRTVYVGRPNLYQGYPIAGTCWSNAAGTATVPAILPWIDLTSGYRYDCKSDGNWFKSGVGSQSGYALEVVQASCNSGSPAQNVAEYLNNVGCTGQTVPVYAYTVAANGEIANLYVTGLTSAVAANANVFTVYKNGTATAVTCTVAIGSKTCTDTTHGVATVVGDYIQFLDTVGNTTTETLITPQASVGIYTQ
jgi:hypothetical protein